MSHNFGLFEVAPAKAQSFEDFVGNVWAKNKNRGYGQMAINEYETTDGRRIVFTGPGEDKHLWCILSVNGQAVDRNVHNWPLALTPPNAVQEPTLVGLFNTLASLIWFWPRQ